MIEGRLWIDPQEGEGHSCAVCGREIFGDKTLCERCANRLIDEEDYE
jgi:uncharacterized OB-fold protein